MLVLSRQPDEAIIIGDDIVITVVGVRGEKVRLGITAPPHVPVHRREVYEAIKREGENAARARGQAPPKVESLAKPRPRTDKDKPPIDKSQT